jgi:hypothetical protein
MRKMINPFLTNNFIDSCAFDPKYAPEDAASAEIFRLHREHALGLEIAHSTLKEVEHPNTPAWVKQAARRLVYTIPKAPTPNEVRYLHQIQTILTGNGKPEKMAQDALHIFEAQKYGSYFITTDDRILKKTDQLLREVSVAILKPVAGQSAHPTSC